MLTPGAVCQSPTSRSGSANGSGLSRTVLTTVKIAVLAPIPRASVINVANVNTGVRTRRRTACRRSRIESVIEISSVTCSLRPRGQLGSAPWRPGPGTVAVPSLEAARAALQQGRGRSRRGNDVGDRTRANMRFLSPTSLLLEDPSHD
jgi:hypothetical protein